MTEQCTTECCDTQKGSSDCCDMPEKLLALADEAWFEVLKDKIKKDILSSSGDKMDKLAKLVSETNNAKWGHMMSGKMQCEEYKQNLQKLFSEASKK